MHVEGNKPNSSYIFLSHERTQNTTYLHISETERSNRAAWFDANSSPSGQMLEQYLEWWPPLHYLPITL